MVSRYKKACLPNTQQNGTKEEGGCLKQEGGGHLRQEQDRGHFNGTKDGGGHLRQGAEAGGDGCQGGHFLDTQVYLNLPL